MGFSRSHQMNTFVLLFATLFAEAEAKNFSLISPVDLHSIVVKDSAVPEAVSARLIFGEMADTLDINATKDLAVDPKGVFAILESGGDDSSQTIINGTNSKFNLSGTHLVLVVDSGVIPNDAGIVRLGTGVSDGKNPVGVSSRWVPLECNPNMKAFLYDSDHDGRKDSIYVFLRGQINDCKSAIIKWKSEEGIADSLTWPMTSSVGSFGLHPKEENKWFKYGFTCSFCILNILDDQNRTVVLLRLFDTANVTGIRKTDRTRFSVVNRVIIAEYQESAIASIQIYSGSGKSVTLFDREVSKNSTVKVNLPSNLVSGIYIIRFTIGHHAIDRKFLLY
jgi:hypothetical protein